jgi:hypothetical protein
MLTALKGNGRIGDKAPWFNANTQKSGRCTKCTPVLTEFGSALVQNKSNFAEVLRIRTIVIATGHAPLLNIEKKASGRDEEHMRMQNQKCALWQLS